MIVFPNLLRNIPRESQNVKEKEMKLCFFGVFYPHEKKARRLMKNTGASQRILSAAVRALTEWEKNSVTLDAFLDELREEHFREKAAVASLLFEYFRHKKEIDSRIARHTTKKTPEREIRLIIACAATQALFQTGIPGQSAVNIAVEQTKLSRGGRSASGFVNAVLRAILREHEEEEKRKKEKEEISKTAGEIQNAGKMISSSSCRLRESALASFPTILGKRWEKRFGKENAAELFACFASDPPLTFRIRGNIQDFSRANAELWEELAPEAVSGLTFTGKFHFFETRRAQALFASDALKNGELYIQDPATALPFSLLGKAPEGKILDACAAPGGKTILLHDLSEQPETMRITVLDRSSARLEQLRENLRRAGLPRIRAVRSDARSTVFPPESFDFILVDPPCSNTGVIRRRPDAPWRFTEKKLPELLQLQYEILNSLSGLLRPGGHLLYSTCSIEEEEDGGQMDRFLREHPDFSEEGRRLLLPSEKHDGAFAALLRKKLS